MRKKRKRPSNGRIMWQGHSQIDGAPIVVIMTGFANKSANAKTGDMLQTWILRSDVSPMKAINTGADRSICGDCPHRGIVLADGNDSVNRLRSCYVNISQAPLGVYECFQRNNYPRMSSKDWSKVKGRFVRLGSYGDPCAVPYTVWSEITRVATGHTGYTHQWRDRSFWRFRKLVMASVETYEQAQQAAFDGWRTFRTMRPGILPGKGEFRCPASKEAGQTLDCAACNACHGATRNKGARQAVSVAITVHGSPSVLGSYRKQFAE